MNQRRRSTHAAPMIHSSDKIKKIFLKKRNQEMNWVEWAREKHEIKLKWHFFFWCADFSSLLFSFRPPEPSSAYRLSHGNEFWFGCVSSRKMREKWTNFPHRSMCASSFELPFHAPDGTSYSHYEPTNWSNRDQFLFFYSTCFKHSVQHSFFTAEILKRIKSVKWKRLNIVLFYAA